MEDTISISNPFRKLFQINVSGHVEKKGQFSYLSWPFAVAQLRLADPTASWEVHRFERLIDETGSDLGNVLDYFGVESLQDLTSQTASRCIKSLEQKRRAA